MKISFGSIFLLMFVTLGSCEKPKTVQSGIASENAKTESKKTETPTVSKEVVVYVSEDQVFSKPILRDFEKATGIKIKAIYDTEEAKSTGTMNRLIAEQQNPQADVYWANEPIRAEVLKQKGILVPYRSKNAEGIPAVFRDPENFWTGFSARARVLIVNTEIVPLRGYGGLPDGLPTGVEAFTNPRWKEKTVIANPLFGTTTSHIAALFTVNEKNAKTFMDGLKTNKVTISTGNGESSDFVAAGKFAFSLVDSDDAVARMRQGKPVRMVYPDQGNGAAGAFIVPNTVMLIKGAPHPEVGKKLIDFLLSKETEKKLAFADCAQIPLHQGVEFPKELKPIEDLTVMKVNYSEVAKKMIEIQPYLKKWVQ